jgi:F-type H+-transporting ATPase subunit epsilon
MAQAQLICLVVTPEATVFDETVEFVAIPLFDGELGVLPGRSPLIGRLGYGELRIRQNGGKTSSYYVDGGFVQVADNVVSILTNRAVLADRINVQAAEEQLSAAVQRHAPTDELQAARERQINQARGQIRVAGRR